MVSVQIAHQDGLLIHRLRSPQASLPLPTRKAPVLSRIHPWPLNPHGLAVSSLRTEAPNRPSSNNLQQVVVTLAPVAPDLLAPRVSSRTTVQRPRTSRANTTETPRAPTARTCRKEGLRAQALETASWLSQGAKTTPRVARSTISPCRSRRLRGRLDPGRVGWRDSTHIRCLRAKDNCKADWCGVMCK